MKRFFDFIPAFFCVLYLDYLVFLVYSLADDGPPPWDLGYGGPPLGLILAVVLFSKRSEFWQRSSRFNRCLLLVLATVGMASIATGILFCFEPGQSNPFATALSLILLLAVASIIWFPLALLISGLYCLPLWAWEGRNDPNHFAGRLVFGFPAYRPYLIWILSLGILSILVFLWHQQPASPAWVNSVPGDGEVLSITSGKAPDGTEVVLAGGYYHSDQSSDDLHVISLDARNGHVRWNEPFQGALPNMSKSPILTNDAKGDVVVAWNYWANPLTSHPIISKLSGVDGRIVWERQAEAGQTLAAKLGAPIPDGMGRIWIPGIQQGQSGHWNRVLGLLDARDGSSHWETVTQKIAHISTNPDPEPGHVFPLNDGDALSIQSPYEDNGWGKTPGSMQRISGKDGTALWEIANPWIGDSVSDEIPLVDEAHQQVVIFSNSVPQRGQSSNLISYDLLTGKERWRFVDEAGASSGMFRAASLDDAGNLVLWRSFGEQIFPNRLAMLVPWPLFPSNEVLNRVRSVREVFSSVDGTRLQSQTFANSSERVQAILSLPGSNKADALILRDWNEKDQILPWKAIFPNRYLWQNVLARLPGGPEASLQFPSQAALTPSGKLVIAGPFGKETRRWEIPRSQPCSQSSSSPLFCRSTE
jgi:outer membrane protein assembly factor BamB